MTTTLNLLIGIEHDGKSASFASVKSKESNTSHLASVYADCVPPVVTSEEIQGKSPNARADNRDKRTTALS